MHSRRLLECVFDANALPIAATNAMAASEILIFFIEFDFSIIECLLFSTGVRLVLFIAQ